MRELGRFRSRDGITRIEVAVIAVVLVVAAVLFMPQPGGSRETDRGNLCRNNMRAVANAVFQYGNDNGRYPGYMNVLQRNDGTPYVDPETGEVTPVSWAVLILPYIDQRPSFDEWRRAPGEPNPTAKPYVPKAGSATVTPQKPWNPRRFIDLFVCPSNQPEKREGALLSFVANTGLPDRPAATPTFTREDHSEVIGTPRDRGANGMFFDNYSEHQLVKTTGPRGPMEYMSDARVKDPHAMTIMFTENVDAGEYVFSSKTHAAEHWKACEVQAGCIWRFAPTDTSTNPPTMTPPVKSLKINTRIGKGDGKNYDYCRPSSHHPGAVNVAFVGQNVMQLNDKISYFVYAKLMTSDDKHVVDADEVFRMYPITETDMAP